MLLAEELDAEPVWVINAGISHRQDIPTSQIGPWIQASPSHIRPAVDFLSVQGSLAAAAAADRSQLQAQSVQVAFFFAHELPLQAPLSR